MKINFLKLFLTITVCELTGIISSIFSLNSIPTWYAALNKPGFSPPNWLFGPVWTILYALMGISWYLLLGKNKSEQSLNFFYIQLGLNFLWSIIFFGMKNPELALIEIILMWGAIFLTISRSLKVSIVAAYLLLPYLAWVSFATILNAAIVVLN